MLYTEILRLLHALCKINFFKYLLMEVEYCTFFGLQCYFWKMNPEILFEVLHTFLFN
jgi:hypothetical protein